MIIVKKDDDLLKLPPYMLWTIEKLLTANMFKKFTCCALIRV